MENRAPLFEESLLSKKICEVNEREKELLKEMSGEKTRMDPDTKRQLAIKLTDIAKTKRLLRLIVDHATRTMQSIVANFR